MQPRANSGSNAEALPPLLLPNGKLVGGNSSKRSNRSAAQADGTAAADSTYASRAKARPTHEFETIDSKRQRRAVKDANRRIAKMGRPSVFQASLNKRASSTSHPPDPSVLYPGATYKSVLDTNEAITSGATDNSIEASVEKLRLQLAICQSNLDAAMKGTQEHDEWMLAFAITAGNLGCLYKNDSQNEEALHYLNLARVAEEEVLQQPSCSTMLNFSAVLLATGNVEDALPIAWRCVEASAAADAFLHVTALHNLAVTQSALPLPPSGNTEHGGNGDGVEENAMETMREALRVAREELGDSHPTTQMIQSKVNNPSSWLAPLKSQSRGGASSRRSTNTTKNDKDANSRHNSKASTTPPRYCHLPQLSTAAVDTMNATAPQERTAFSGAGNGQRGANDAEFASTMPVRGSADRRQAKEAVLTMNFDTPKKKWFKRGKSGGGGGGGSVRNDDGDVDHTGGSVSATPAGEKFNPEVKPRSDHGPRDLPLRRSTKVDPTLRRTTVYDPTIRRVSMQPPTLRAESTTDPSLRRTSVADPRLWATETRPPYTEEQRYAREHYGAPSFTRFAPSNLKQSPDRLTYSAARARLLGDAVSSNAGNTPDKMAASDIVHDPSSRSVFQTPNRDLILAIEQQDEAAYRQQRQGQLEEEQRQRDFEERLERLRARTQHRAAQRIQQQWRPWWEQTGKGRKEARERDCGAAAQQSASTQQQQHKHKRSSGPDSAERLAGRYPASVQWCARRWLSRTPCVRYLARHGIPHHGKREREIALGLAKFQAAWRGMRSRDALRRELAQQADALEARGAQEEREFAATLIQAQQRGAAARAAYAEHQYARGAPAREAAAQERAEEEQRQRETDAAVAIQRTWRRHDDYVAYLMSLINQSVSRVRDQEYDGARTIQRVGRGAAERATVAERLAKIRENQRALEEDQRLFEEQRRLWSQEAPEREAGGAEEQVPSMESVVAPASGQPMSEPERAAYARYVNTRPVEVARARAQEDWYTQKEAQAALGGGAAAKIQRAYRSWRNHKNNPNRDRRLLLASRASYRARELRRREELEERRRKQEMLGDATPAHDMRGQLQAEIDRLEALDPRTVPIRDPVSRYANEESLQRREKLVAAGPTFLKEY